MRIVVSYSKTEKARKYKDTLKGVGGGAFEIVDADSNAPASTADWRALQLHADALLLTGGPDVDRHVELLEKYAKAGYTHVYVHQVGPDQDGFLDFYASEILPRYSHAAVSA